MSSAQNHSRFELHSFTTTAAAEAPANPLDFTSLPWCADQQSRPQVLAIDFGEGQTGVHHVGINRDKNALRSVKTAGDAVAAFYFVQRRLGPALAIVPRGSPLLVNGLPALSFQVLSPRAGLLLYPGLHTYVTQRIRPYIGPPTEEMLNQKMRCPCCRIPLDPSTRVVTCRCGAAYHQETAESHPEVVADDRLNCFAQIRVCLSCQRPLMLQESLVWNPPSL